MTEWQPIETAPKDGPKPINDEYPFLLLGWYPDLPMWEIIYWYDGPKWQGWRDIDGSIGIPEYRQPTHWMPLPEPPVKP